MKTILILALAGFAAFPAAAPAQAAMLGDVSACEVGDMPAIRANIVGLKDRTGELKLELYPANKDDFLKDDRDLLKEGKVFRRVRVATPGTGPVSLCISVPHPGRYALLFTHDRDGKNKFNFWTDGAGFPSNKKLGRARTEVNEATIDVPDGVATTTIVAQYLRGFSGFGPVGNN
jgi:uncharacterized protein (DUF2141 family)